MPSLHELMMSAVLVWVSALSPLDDRSQSTGTRRAGVRADRGGPQRFGVPLPRGLVRDPDALWIAAGRRGRQRVGGAVSSVLARWADGSARWVGCEVDGGEARSTRLVVRRGGARDSRKPRRVTVIGGEDGVVVDCAERRWRFREGGVSIPWSMTERRRPRIAPGRGLQWWLVDAAGVCEGGRFLARAISREITSLPGTRPAASMPATGPMRPLAWGDWRVKRAAHSVTLTARSVPTEETVVGGHAADETAVADATLTVVLSARTGAIAFRLCRYPSATRLFGVLPVRRARRLVCGGAVVSTGVRRGRAADAGGAGTGVARLTVTERLRVELSGASDREEAVDWRGCFRVECDDRVSVFGVVDAGRRGVFRAQLADGALSFAVRDRDRPWGRGQRDRFQLRWTMARTSSRLDLERRARAWAADPRGVFLVDPGGLRDKAALAVPGAASTSLLRATLAALLDEYDSVAYRTPTDCGDYRVQHLGWANGEFDAIGALVRSTLWTRGCRSWRWARRAVDHLLDVDLDRGGSGLPHRHGPNHEGGADLGHVWLGGLLDYALLAADAEALEAAAGIATGVEQAVRGAAFRLRRERDYGWALVALTRASAVWPRFAAARDRLARALTQRVRADGLVAIEAGRRAGELRTTTYTALGILVPALAALPAPIGRCAPKRIAARIVARYREAAWCEERRHLAWSIHSGAAGRSAPLRTTGRVRGGDLLFVAAGVAAVAGSRAPGWPTELATIGAKTFRRSGFGRDNGERVRALHGLYDLALLGIRIE